MSTEYIWFKRGKEHRRTADPEGKLPTLIKPTPNTEIKYSYYKDGSSVQYESYYKNGKLHRDEDKPAEVVYYEDGSVYSKNYYKDGLEYTP